jgi:hypothetical protein
MMPCLSSNPALLDAILRLKNGIAYPGDFKDFLSAIRSFSESADANAIYGVGEQGQAAKGVAQAYREIVRMIDEAEPISCPPGDSLDPTGISNRGQPAPAP